MKRSNNSKKIVFTHGVFDLFHTGHLYTLKKAKSLGNYLIVGVDSDRLVKLVKGNNRPVINQNDRIEIIESIKFVDEVILIDTHNPDEKVREEYFVKLYKKIKPNIIISGKCNNWTKFQERVCNELNIEFKAIGKKEGVISTTEIIKDIKLNH